MTTMYIISGSVYYTTADGNESILQTSSLSYLPLSILFAINSADSHMICLTLSSRAVYRRIRALCAKRARAAQRRPQCAIPVICNATSDRFTPQLLEPVHN